MAQTQQLEDQLSEYRQKIKQLECEKNNLQLMLNCIMANQTKNILIQNKEIRSSTIQCDQNNLNKFKQFLDQSESRFSIPLAIKSTDQQNFFQLDLLHQTTNLMEEHQKSNKLKKIFSKHFINVKTLFLMLEQEHYSHALLKMINFANELVEIIVKAEIQTQKFKLNLNKKSKNNFDSILNSQCSTDRKHYMPDQFSQRIRTEISLSSTPEIRDILESLKGFKQKKASVLKT